MSSHHESSPHVFDLLGIGWLRTNAEGIPLDANDQCAGLFDAPDSAALIERMRAGAVVLPDELMMHLRSARNVQPGELVASRIACMLRPEAARVYVSVIARDDAFDVLLLPGSMTPPSRSDFALRDYARRLRLLKIGRAHV